MGFQDVLFLRGSHGALSFENHEDVIIVLVVVHVVLHVCLAVDGPEIGKVGTPERKVANFGVCPSLRDGVFYLGH